MYLADPKMNSLYFGKIKNWSQTNICGENLSDIKKLKMGFWNHRHSRPPHPMHSLEENIDIRRSLINIHQ